MRKTLLPLALLLGLAGAARADFNPIPIAPGSFNGDAVIESTAPPAIGLAVNATIDNGTALQAGSGTPFGGTWNERGYFPANPNTGLPPAGSTFTAISNSAVSFTMAPSYTANNAILINGSVTNGTWIPVTPAAYSSLSFLSSGGNGGRAINVTAHHADGTTSTGSFSSPDWFNNTTGVGWIAAGRLSAQNYAGDNLGTSNPRLLFRNVAIANTTSPITNITLTLGTGGGTGHVGVMAVSGSTDGINYTPIAVTGYTVDVVVEATAPQPGAMTTATTLTMEGGAANTGNTWFERGYHTFQPTSGLPVAGSTIASLQDPTRQYQLPPSYTANNVIYVDSNAPTANITFTTPGAYSALSFLSTTANGNVTNQCTIQHQDGSSEVKNFVARDWFNNTPFAYNANGRISTDNKLFNTVNANPQNPRLYEAQFALGNTVSPVTNIVLTWSAAPNINGRTFVFAVSGSTGPVAPIIGESPQGQVMYEGSPFSLTATVTDGSAPFTYRWQVGTNGTYVDLADGGRWSGTDTLTLNNSASTLADNADFRVRVSNAAGPANSGAAAITVLSSNLNVLQPGDTIIPVVNNSPAGEAVQFAIDNTTSKYLNFGLNAGSATPVGFIVTPSLGSTFVTGIRLFTASDATERDPANTILEGSNNGGNTWSLIWSNSFTLPTARNAGGLAINPLTQPMIERNFANPTAYTMYRWRVSELRNRPNANSMQIGEVQLLGISNDSPQPIFITQPTSVSVYDDGAAFASFFAVATGSPEPTYQWQKGTNGVFVNVVDGGNVSGAQSVFLSISPVTLADAADYVCIASNPAGDTYSTVVRLSVVSPLPDVTLPGDSVSVFGDLSGNTGTAGSLLDNTTTGYLNGGSGPSAPAGFPPWEGPAGVVITPSKGATLVTAMRIYTSDGTAAGDPTDYLLEGSNDGTTFTTIAAGTLDLPETRNAPALATDPLTQALQEVRFANTQPYSSYRLTVTGVEDEDATAVMRIGELELLGISGPTITITPEAINVLPGGNAQFSALATGTGTLSYQWKKRVGNSYVNVADGGPISGAQTDTLVFAGVTLANDGEYVVQVTDGVLPATSTVVILNVISDKLDVTQPTDPIVIYGGTTPAGEVVEHATDDLTDKYLNFGLDGNEVAPFLGPVGLVVTPASGATLLTGLRIYTANDAPERDPADYVLEGSNNGGASFTTIASGPVYLPSARNAGNLLIDPLALANREVRFANSAAFTTYRLSFVNVRNNAQANAMQLGEVELLGTVVPVLTFAMNGDGSFTITSSLPGTLQSTTDLQETGTIWTNEGPINLSVTITPDPEEPQKFYRVSQP
jgi:hypothetical protein